MNQTSEVTPTLTPPEPALIKWEEDQNQSMIKDIFPPGQLQPPTIMSGQTSVKAAYADQAVGDTDQTISATDINPSTLKTSSNNPTIYTQTSSLLNTHKDHTRIDSIYSEKALNSISQIENSQHSESTIS